MWSLLAWSPDRRFVLYSGPDVGTTFAVKIAALLRVFAGRGSAFWQSRGVHWKFPLDARVAVLYLPCVSFDSLEVPSAVQLSAAEMDFEPSFAIAASTAS